MTRHEFFEWLEDAHIDGRAEPFCPFEDEWFGYGYCDVAYSKYCYNCEFAQKWLKEHEKSN